MTTINYTAEPTRDGSGWHVIERKWRPQKRGHPRPAPIERILRTFTGPSAQREAFALAARKMGKRGKPGEKRRMH